jgi:hypothetical protein
LNHAVVGKKQQEVGTICAHECLSARFQSALDGEVTKMMKVQPTRAGEARSRPDLAQLMSEVCALRERTKALEARLEIEMSGGSQRDPYEKPKKPSLNGVAVHR